jgi:hypothetical protein
MDEQGFKSARAGDETGDGKSHEAIFPANAGNTARMTAEAASDKPGESA